MSSFQKGSDVYLSSNEEVKVACLPLGPKLKDDADPLLWLPCCSSLSTWIRNSLNELAVSVGTKFRHCIEATAVAALSGGAFAIQ